RIAGISAAGFHKLTVKFNRQTLFTTIFKATTAGTTCSGSATSTTDTNLAGTTRCYGDRRTIFQAVQTERPQGYAIRFTTKFDIANINSRPAQALIKSQTIRGNVDGTVTQMHVIASIGQPHPSTIFIHS